MERFTKRRRSAHFDEHGRYASCGRFFAQFTKESGQILFAVVVYDCCRGEARSRIHSHVEWAISHQTEPALRVFELAGRNPEIKKRASDGANPELVQNTIGVSKIRLPDDDAPAKVRQMLGHVPDRIRILVQSQDFSTTFQKRFGVTAAPTGSVEH